MNADDHKFITTVGSLIRELRKQHGLSAQELSTRIGHKSPSHLLRIERGEINAKLNTIQRIAKVLGTDAHQLTLQAIARINEQK